MRGGTGWAKPVATVTGEGFKRREFAHGGLEGGVGFRGVRVLWLFAQCGVAFRRAENPLARSSLRASNDHNDLCRR